MVCMSAMDRFIIRLGSYQHNRAHPFPWINEALQQPTKCRCNNLHFHLATTYIFGLQLGGADENLDRLTPLFFIAVFFISL